jgi:hypothetical protein
VPQSVLKTHLNEFAGRNFHLQRVLLEGMGHITSIYTPEQEDNTPERNGLSVCREKQAIQLLEKGNKSLRLDRLKRFSNDIQNYLWGNLNAHKRLRK